MCVDNEKSVPPMDNLPPDGDIDWAEISSFIEDMLDAYNRCEKGWGIIKDTSATKDLRQSSVRVLNILYSDLYEYFYVQRGDRNEIWARMEKYIRTKYANLSAKALSRVIAVYHVDDR